MKKIIAISLFTLIFSGCATVNRVNVNGYLNTTEFPRPISPGSSFFVRTAKGAKNPIFESEVKTKIENLVRQKGYRVAAYKDADFLVDFESSMSPGRRITEYQPIYHYGETTAVVTQTASGKTRIAHIQYPGYTSYVPWQREEYTATLDLEVNAGPPLRTTKERKTIWVGEAANISDNPDKRSEVTYLLAALSKHFLEDTHASVVTNVRAKDPEVTALLYPSGVSGQTGAVLMDDHKVKRGL